MVLEGASAPQESSFSETIPTSDIDPYATGNPPYTETREPSYVLVTPPGANQVYVNLNNLPRRFSIFGLSQHPDYFANSLKEACIRSQNILHRPVTQEEADAFAFHFAKALRIASYGAPGGIALSMVQAYRGRLSYRFPLWSPMKEGGRFSPNKFGPLKEQWARIWWQASRISAYIAAGMILGSTFASGYAISVSTAGRAMDPRLKEFNEKMKQRTRDGVGVQAPGRPADESDGPRKEETYEMARQRRSAQEMWKNNKSQRQSTSTSTSTGDDMSPTGGAFQDDFVTAGSDTGLLDDTQMRQEQWQPVYREQASSRQDSAENSASGFDFDQSSPRSQTVDSPPSRSSAQTAGKPSGSAWDRLRQNAMTSGPSTPASSSRSQSRPLASERGRNSPSGSDSFSYSQNDEDRQLAKSEAQKHFDARIEKEREGKNFDDRGGGRSKW